MDRFHQVLGIARNQNAMMLELRAGTSLARLWLGQNRPGDAGDLLAPIYGWFAEGFETSDLKDARALLDEVAQPGAGSGAPRPAHAKASGMEAFFFAMNSVSAWSMAGSRGGAWSSASIFFHSALARWAVSGAPSACHRSKELLSAPVER